LGGAMREGCAKKALSLLVVQTAGRRQSWCGQSVSQRFTAEIFVLSSVCSRLKTNAIQPT
jgi:hypothetical protein